tara:strand:- start:1701 stop:2285 length:585 start_codon:yes stop_codon:yes gene_type:complete
MLTGGNAVIALEQQNFSNILLSDYLEQTVSLLDIQCPIWIGVFYENNDGLLECGGYTTWDNQNFAITAWGDDATTLEKDGFSDGDEYVFKICIEEFGEFLGVANMSVEPPFSNFYITNGFGSVESILFSTEDDDLNSVIDLAQSCWPVDIQDNTSKQHLIRTIDLYGREVQKNVKNKLVFQIHSDNTIFKTYQF